MKYILTAVILGFFLGSFAQGVPPSQTLIAVGMTSPETASLGKFGNIPVSYSTGVPEISIPIFNNLD